MIHAFSSLLLITLSDAAKPLRKLKRKSKEFSSPLPEFKDITPRPHPAVSSDKLSIFAIFSGFHVSIYSQVNLFQLKLALRNLAILQVY